MNRESAIDINKEGFLEFIKKQEMKNGNPVINKRIEYFINKKKELLKMKKSERRGELKTVDDTIARLKRWNRELEAKKQRELIQKSGERMAKACQNTVKATKQLKEALERIPEGHGTYDPEKTNIIQVTVNK